jgi:hypothetical protein
VAEHEGQGCGRRRKKRRQVTAAPPAHVHLYYIRVNDWG